MDAEKSLKNLFKNMNFGFDITILTPSLHFQTKTMKFIAEIDVMPLKALLDPQGKAVSGSMKNLGLPEITNVRIGKHIQLEVEAISEEDARAKVDKACKQLLANQIMESYSFSVAAV
jgi:phosphoribosylformylglycinamidine synthase